MDSEYISHLLYHYIIGDISDAGRRDLTEWSAENEYNRKVLERLQDKDYLQREYRRIKAVDATRAMKDMESRIATAQLSDRRPWGKVRVFALSVAGVAASIALLVGFYIYSRRLSPEPTKAVVAQVASSKISHGSTQAILTLENGDTLHLGASATDNAAKMADGHSLFGDRHAKLSVSTPRGGEFKVTLEMVQRCGSTQRPSLATPSTSVMRSVVLPSPVRLSSRSPKTASAHSMLRRQGRWSESMAHSLMSMLIQRIRLWPQRSSRVALPCRQLPAMGHS